MVVSQKFISLVPLMILLHSRRDNINFVATLALVCFIFVINTTDAVPQDAFSSEPPSTTRFDLEAGSLILQVPEAPEFEEDVPVDPSPTTPSELEDKWWIPIGVAIIATFGSVIVAILNPQFVSAIFNLGKKQRSTLTKRLRGLVLDKVTGVGVQGAHISLEAKGIPSVQSTDAMGNFFFSFQCSEDVIRVRVSANGYQRYDRLVDFPSGTETLAIEINLSRES